MVLLLFLLSGKINIEFDYWKPTDEMFWQCNKILIIIHWYLRSFNIVDQFHNTNLNKTYEKYHH